MNNIFVLCTGRCGSMTMARACQHATNYTAAHESWVLRNDLAYPDNHIEVNNRLTWFLGLMDAKFPDARYVHLTRDPEAVAISHAKHCVNQPAKIINGWRNVMRMGWQRHKHPDRDVMTDCREYVAAVTGLITVFLRSPDINGDPRDWVHVDIDKPDSFRQFWHWAGCAGSLDRAMATFKTRHNMKVRRRRRSG